MSKPGGLERNRSEEKREAAQGLVEYALILGLMSVLVLTVFVMFNSIADIGRDSSGTLSTEGVGRAKASLSAGVY